MERDLPDLTKMHLPALRPGDARKVEKGFWKKLLRLTSRIPFAEDAAAAYFCTIDPATPNSVKAILIAALAYFVTPVDLIPDFVAGIGFTDDAAVLAMALSLVSGHVRPHHRQRARAALDLPPLADEN